jgi:galactokinase
MTSISPLRSTDVGNGLVSEFESIFGSLPAVEVFSPGRAEIVGNHTDYNSGFALSCTTSHHIYALFGKRSDERFRIISRSFPLQPVEFSLRTLQDQRDDWGRYPQAVVAELESFAPLRHGADILMDTSVPLTGGVSSSAAIEVAVALGVQKINEIEMTPLQTALLCKRAENGPLVDTACGFLDQGTIVLAERGKVIFFDFGALHEPFVETELIDCDLQEAGLQFVIALDLAVKRNLGSTGYANRRRVCESSLPILSELLGYPISSLRQISVPQFQDLQRSLEERGGKEMCRRVEHVVFENERVIQAASALRKREFSRLGELLTSSGRSALELYDLDAGTPELTLLVDSARRLDGVLGTRNMGGGFSAVSLSLVIGDARPHFERALSTVYQNVVGRPLQFLSFAPSHHAEARTLV